MTSRARIVLAVLLVAAAGPAGFFTYRVLVSEHWISPPGVRARAAPERSSAPSVSPAPAQAAAQQPAPDVLPDLSFPDAQGKVRDLSSWRGQPLLVNFWATWCEPCRREIPLFESLRREPAGRPLQVVGIAVDQRDAAEKYARAMKIDYPILFAGEDAGLKAIGTFGSAEVLPFTVFADARGRILSVKVGEVHPEEAHLILARLADLSAGRLGLAAAREEISSGLAALAVERARHAMAASANSGQ